jgi:hypothetical protein
MPDPIPDRRPKPGYAVFPYGEDDAVGEQEVLDLWEREGVLRPERAEARLHELLFVATHEDDGLVAVSSAYLQRNEQLGMSLWHLRVFVAAAHRKSNLAATLAVRGRERLEQRFTSGEDRRGAGMISQVENEGLRRLNRAVWRQTRFAFIGETPEGDHVRVWYFPGALAPEPPRRP